MRKLLIVMSAALIIFGVASQANAKALDWSGTMVIELGVLPDIVVTGTAVATVNNSTGSEHLNTLRIAGGLTATGQVVPVTDPEVTMTIPSVIVTLRLGTGTLTGISGGAPMGQRVLPVPGLARVCLFFSGCGANFKLTLTANNGNTGIGIGGAIIADPALGVFRISIEANPWTIGTGMGISQTKGNGTMFETRTRAGFVHGPASNTSTTAARLGSGVIQLISPMQLVSINLPGNNEKLALFNTLTIHFIPEPGLLLLLGSGVAGLVLIGRSRTRKK